MGESIEFPQFRKLANNRNYYRIDSNEMFEEVQVMGKYWWKSQLKATIYPERLLIMDMLACEDQRWSRIDQREFEAFLAHCEANLEERTV